MVSENPTQVGTSSDRGFLSEETIVALTKPRDRDLEAPIPSFWGSVVGGAVVVLGLEVLSGLLMFGCHVGVVGDGNPSFGVGTGIWMIVTACIAYFIGGFVASQLSFSGGWIRGLVMWGLTIPLMLLISAAILAGAGLAYAHTTHLAEQITNNSGAATLVGGNLAINSLGVWTAFIAVGAGLLFAMIGSSAKCGCENSKGESKAS